MDVVSTHVPIHLAVCISGCHFDKYTESKTSTIISKKLSVVFSTKCQYLKSFQKERKKERWMYWVLKITRDWKIKEKMLIITDVDCLKHMLLPNLLE